MPITREDAVVKIKLCFALVTLLASAGAFGAQQPQKAPNDTLADQVRKAIDKGVRYLKDHQQPNGSWEDTPVLPPGGQTTLALLALLNAGVKADDDTVKKGLDFIRKLEKPATYVRSLQTMVLVEVGQPQDLELIQENVKHLLKIAIKDGGNLLGWGYDRGGGGFPSRPDNSNTQYAVLALWVARQHGLPKSIWEEVNDFYTKSQSKRGSWGYEYHPGGESIDERLTMTSAGLCGLFIAEMEMAAGRQNADPVAICGIYDDNHAIKAGLAWINAGPGSPDRFNIEPASHVFYNLYGIERLGRLSGQRFLGSHDWYREGCKWLVKEQSRNDGSWSRPQSADIYPTISTSFAVLFLSKGRTPVLISKLAFGRQNVGREDDWNRRHNDLRHLVEFASDKVFKKMPLAWQIFDVRRQTNITPQKLDDLTSELLQSPILYLTGHESPAKRLSGVEKNLLKSYVDNGGFILAAACCGSEDFSNGFKELCEKELWPDNELTDLDFDHPVWSMRFGDVKPGSVRLKGIQQGCKTVVILSQDNLCGFWEINRQIGEGQTAFHLGANIVAYATGLEPPKPRLTPMPVLAKIKDDPLASPLRGYFQVGQLIGQVGDEAAWKPAPQAMSMLMQNLRDRAGLDVVPKTVNVPIDAKDITKFKFLYMHGRKDFRFESNQLERLRFNLKNGGLLLADACCGKEAFDKGFRQFMLDLFPKEAFASGEVPRLAVIPPDDPLFSKELNGEALTDANIQCRTVAGQPFQAIRPALEGIKIGQRWVAIYSKYDIGCALEKHQSADCVGYSHESALRLGRAAVLYQFRP
jgi:Domain of unknown function (DUF4159)